MAIVNVVQYNGGNEAFAWKYPISELATWTQLIVNESQEAVLVKTGMITDIFTAGRYVLDTNNIPILNISFLLQLHKASFVKLSLKLAKVTKK